MSADRYLKVILTIIALELGWIGLTLSAPPVSAQAQAEPTPVIISGVQLRDRADFLPVGVLGQPRAVPAAVARAFQPLDTTVRNDQPLRVTLPVPLDVRTVTPIRIDSDRPIKVENVGYTPAQRPGE
jgi:hypothetical protein